MNIQHSVEELDFKIGVQNYKMETIEASIEQQSEKILKVDEKVDTIDVRIDAIQNTVNDIVDVKDKMLLKIGDIDYLLEERKKHIELIEELANRADKQDEKLKNTEEKFREITDKLRHKVEENDNTLASLTSQIKLFEKVTQDHTDGIKQLGGKIDQQGLLLVDHIKQLAGHDEKIKEVREEIRDVKKLMGKIDTVDKRVSDLTTQIDMQLNESKKTIDDFTLRLKFIDAKNEETDSNFGVIQERFNYNEEKINSIEGYNEAFGNQIKNKFDEVELKFEEELKNFDILEKNNEEIIN